MNPADILSPLINLCWKYIEKKRKIRFTIHYAYFKGIKDKYLFLNVTNLSTERKIEITHVYFQKHTGQIPVIQNDRPLPKRLKPDETWETWYRFENLPVSIKRNPYNKGRVRLSTGKIIKSRFNKNVPDTGTVPGGPVTVI